MAARHGGIPSATINVYVAPTSLLRVQRRHCCHLDAGTSQGSARSAASRSAKRRGAQVCCLELPRQAAMRATMVLLALRGWERVNVRPRSAANVQPRRGLRAPRCQLLSQAGCMPRLGNYLRTPPPAATCRAAQPIRRVCLSHARRRQPPRDQSGTNLTGYQCIYRGSSTTKNNGCVTCTSMRERNTGSWWPAYAWQTTAAAF